MDKICTVCNNTFPATLEYFHSKGRGRLDTKCHSCKNQAKRTAYISWTEEQMENKRINGRALEFTTKRRFGSYKKRAGKHKRAFNISLKKFEHITSQPCYYCNKFSVKKNDRNIQLSSCGIDRTDSKKGYTTGNIVPCCNKCNTAKFDMSVKELAIHIRDMYITMSNKGLI